MSIIKLGLELQERLLAAVDYEWPHSFMKSATGYIQVKRYILAAIIVLQIATFSNCARGFIRYPQFILTQS